jgi:hypothetical protein
MNIRVLIIALLIPLAALAAQPSGDRLAGVVDAPLIEDPVRKNLTTLTTTLLDAIDAQNTKKTLEVSQLFVVTNLDDTTDVCIGSIPVTAAETCDETLCATAGKWTANGYAAAMNCTEGDASRGSVVPPGQSRSFRYAGTRCVCMVASGASTSVQVERIVR